MGLRNFISTCLCFKCETAELNWAGRLVVTQSFDVKLTYFMLAVQSTRLSARCCSGHTLLFLSSHEGEGQSTKKVIFTACRNEIATVHCFYCMDS